MKPAPSLLFLVLLGLPFLPGWGQEKEVPPAGPLEVLVVDGAGQPVAKVPLAVHIIGHGRSWKVTARFVTGGDGVGRLAHTRGLAQELGKVRMASLVGRICPEPDWAKAWCPRGRFRLALTFGFPQAQPRVVTFHPGFPPEGPVRLVLPPTGGVAITLVDGEGRPLPGSFPVDLAGAGLPGGRSVLAEGRILFPRVALGLKLEAHIDIPSFLGPDWTFRFQGPQVAGEEKSVRLTLPGVAPLLTGRILDRRGEALAGEWIQVTLPRFLAPGRKGISGLKTTTDAGGRFRVLFHDRVAEAAAGPLCFLQPTTASRHPGFTILGAARAGARVPVPVPEGKRVVDLGDIRLAPPPRIQAGRVVGPEGEPVAGAVVVVERLLVRPRGEGQVPEADWRIEWDQVVETDVRGRFELRGFLDGGPLRVRARPAEGSSLCCSRARLVREGKGSCVLDLQGAGSVSGSLRVEEWVPREKLQVLLHLPREKWDGGERPPAHQDDIWAEGSPLDPFRPVRRATVSAAGRFGWEKVPPGPCRITIGVEGDPEPILEIGPIQVRPGEKAVDSRLADIDLRGRVRRFVLTLQPPERASGKEQVEIAKAPGFACPDKAAMGRHVLVTAMESLDLEIRGDRIRTCRVTGVDGDRRIKLSPPLQVTLVLKEAARFCRPPFSLSVAGSTDRGGLGQGRLIRVTPEGRALLTFPGPGPYFLFWWITYEGCVSRHGPGRIGYPYSRIASRIEVEPELSGGSLQVTLSPAVRRHLLRRAAEARIHYRQMR